MAQIQNDLIKFKISAEALAVNDAVYVDASTGKVGKLDPTDVNKRGFVGFTLDAATGVDEDVRIAYVGRVKGFSSLTPGSILYASLTTPGSFQTTEPTTGQFKIVLGTAHSATEVFINAALSSTNEEVGASSGGGAALDISINQVAHGFSVGDPIYADSTTTYALAIANSASTLVDYVVSEVVDVDNFKAIKLGPITITGHGFSPAGDHFFLSDTIAGGHTATEPAIFSAPTFQVVDVDIVFVNLVRPADVSGTGSEGGGSSSSVDTVLVGFAELNPTDANTIILMGGSPNNAGAAYSLRNPDGSVYSIPAGKKLRILGGRLYSNSANQNIAIGYNDTNSNLSGLDFGPVNPVYPTPSAVGTFSNSIITTSDFEDNFFPMFFDVPTGKFPFVTTQNGSPSLYRVTIAAILLDI